MKQGKQGHSTTTGLRAILAIACALLVSLGQPLAALTRVDDCTRCEQGDLRAACCCAPEANRGTTPVEPAVDEGGSCCAETPAPPGDAELDAPHDCCCDSAPECPVVPVHLPPLQDVTRAGSSSRALAAGCVLSMRTIHGFEEAATAPGVPCGVSPPRTEASNGTRLVRAAVQGNSRFLTLISVARL